MVLSVVEHSFWKDCRCCHPLMGLLVPEPSSSMLRLPVLTIMLSSSPLRCFGLFPAVLNVGHITALILLTRFFFQENLVDLGLKRKSS